MKFYGFWRYDQFPYVLGGEIQSLIDDSIETKNYGKGYRFHAIKILSLKEGIELQTKLDKIKSDYNTELNKLYRQYKEKLKQAFPEALQKDA